MSRLKRLISTVLLLLSLLVAAYFWHQYRERNPVIQDIPRRGGLDVTLLAISDLHFGGKILGRGANGRQTWVQAMPVRRTIDKQMRSMMGKPYPKRIGGVVGEPVCLLIPGDLTEDGKESEWEEFASFYGLDPHSAQSHSGLPVYECVGNHDLHEGSYVSRQVAARHGGKYYSIDYGDLHIVNLDAAPDQKGLHWLERDLAATGRARPGVSA
jgi:hypothetical protein